MERILIGKTASAVGLKGEIKINSYSTAENRYENLEKIFIGGKEMHIESVRYNKGLPILKLKEINDRNAAEAIRNLNVEMDAAELPELEEGEFYVKDLIGVSVYNFYNGEKVGIIKDIITDRAQDVYVIEGEEENEILIPVVEEFVKTIDPKEDRIEITPIEGLI